MPASIFSETELATLHALRRFLFFAHEGKVQRRQADQQTNQVLCLNLVTNAIVTWNTVYMNAAIERLRAEGRIGRRGSTGDTALRLGHFFGTSAEFWLNLQKLYALRLVKKKGQQDDPVLADPLRTNTPAPETPLVGLSPSLPAGTFETPIA